MAFANPLKGEPPDDYRANDSCRDNLCRWDFFMLNYILVGVGSAMGGISRDCASGLMVNRFGQSFPWGTLFVNVTGSFVIALFATLTAPEGPWLVDPSGRNFFMTGFCGGYATFSSFSLQALSLAQDEEWLYTGGIHYRADEENAIGASNPQR